MFAFPGPALLRFSCPCLALLRFPCPSRALLRMESLEGDVAILAFGWVVEDLVVVFDGLRPCFENLDTVVRGESVDLGTLGGDVFPMEGRVGVCGRPTRIVVDPDVPRSDSLRLE